jgi:K+-sensing histidine kinase KdpD
MRRPSPSASELLSLTVHEFRTPITIVGGYLRMLQRDTSGSLSDAQRRMVEEAEKSCGRLAGLVGELSDLSNLEAGTAAFNRQNIAVAPLIEHTVEALDPGEKSRTELRPLDPTVRVNVDGTRLSHAIRAVLGAIRRELLPDAKVVIALKVSSGRSGRTVTIAMGLEPSVEKLLRMTASKRPPFNIWRGGCGLSVVVADRVVAAHGGTIVAAGEAPGEAAGGIVLPSLEPQRG